MKSLCVSICFLALAVTLPASAQEGGTAVGGLTFQSDTFKLAAGRGMVAATATPILKEGEKVAAKPIVAKFYYFGPGQGGSVDANIARWVGQFDDSAGKPEVKKEEVNVGEKSYTLLHVEGTYMDGPPLGAKVPTANSAMLAAIIPGKDAPVFIKLTGPKDQVIPTKDGFKAMAASGLK